MSWRVKGSEFKVLVQARFFSSPKLVQGALSLGKSHWGVKLTAHLHLMPRSRMVVLYLHSPIHLHGIMLNN
jgi:hypothetical protein